MSFFLHEQNFWRIKFTPKKRVNYSKIHSKLPIFCVITAKYTVNYQIFALNLKKFTPAKKNLQEYIRGVRDKYEVWSLVVLKLMLCKPLVTIQDRTKEKIINRLFHIIGTNINGTSLHVYACFLAWRVYNWGAEEDTSREETQVQRYQQVPK